ncbi:MAG TPA: hypothetical protein VFY16_11920, partial [Gemmatimonadaceae bacterium]|nr:hypothetical protein [Gemmatimonadaceae bacterium]
MRTPALLLLAAIAATPITTASAQRPGTPWVKTLARPAGELAEPFSAIGGVRELSDGRVLVVDRREKAVRLVDLDAGAATQVGREGSGPGEYGLPMMLMPLPGDSTLLFDGMNARYHAIDPSGKIVGSLSLLGEGPGLGLGLVRGVDGAGRLYFLDRGLRGGPGMPAQTPDSGAIVRYDRARKRADTVAYVRLPKMNVQRGGSGGQIQVRVSGPAPFTPQDEFAIGQDGRIALVHVNDYRVEWIAPNGQRVLGRPNPFAPIRITDADREQLRQ